MDNKNIKDYYALNESNMYNKTDIYVNKEIFISKTFTEQDIETFIELSGDNNPIHHDESFSQKTIFKGRIAHGLLAVGLISSALTRLMGAGNVWLSQNFEFRKPIKINDTITAELKITDIGKNGVCIIETTCKNQKGEIIVEGQAKSRVFPVKNQNKTSTE